MRILALTRDNNSMIHNLGILIRDHCKLLKVRPTWNKVTLLEALPPSWSIQCLNRDSSRWLAPMDPTAVLHTRATRLYQNTHQLEPQCRANPISRWPIRVHQTLRKWTGTPWGPSVETATSTVKNSSQVWLAVRTLTNSIPLDRPPMPKELFLTKRLARSPKSLVKMLLIVIKRGCTYNSNLRLNKIGLKLREMKTQTIKVKVRLTALKSPDRQKEVSPLRFLLDLKMNVVEVALSLVIPMHIRNLSNSNHPENILA